GPLAVQDDHPVLDGLDAADARADHDAPAGGVTGGEVQPGVPDGFLGRPHAQQGAAVDPLGLAVFEEVAGPVADLPGDPDRPALELAEVGQVDVADARPTLAH